MKKNKMSLIVCLILLVTSVLLPRLIVFGEYEKLKIDNNLDSKFIPDHVTLTWTGEPKTTQTITWRTNTSVKNGMVQYITFKTRKLKVKTAYAKKEVMLSAPSDPYKGSINIFSASLRNLKPGTKYYYRVGNGTNWSRLSSFTTEARNNTKFKFLIFGDSQGGSDTVPNYIPFNNTIKAAIKYNSDAKFIINTGDLVEKGQNYEHWNEWFNSVKGIIDKIPIMPVQGNHETYNGVNWKSSVPKYYKYQFKLPQNGPGGFKGQVYSYDYGNAHFAVLNSQRLEEAPQDNNFLKTQADWLDKDLRDSKKKFKIVLLHKPLYQNKSIEDNTDLRKAFSRIIEKNNVDVVFSGHDHVLSRTYPIKSGQTNPVRGTVYYITGRSGSKYYKSLKSKTWNEFFYNPADMPCYETVEIDNSRLIINAYKQDGKMLDNFIIDKSDH